MSAYSILSKRQFRSPECSLLLARCCCDLKKYGEAEQTLLGRTKDKKSTCLKGTLSTDELVANFGDAASFAAQLLALICSKTERLNKAIDYYKKSLKLNPFLWSSFEKLIQLGSKPDSSKIFNINNVDFNLCHGNNPLVNLWNMNEKNENSAPNQLLHSNLQNSQNQNTINSTQQPSSEKMVCSNVSNTLFSVKEIHQSMEILSSFAFIKSTPDVSAIDVIAPENNTWVTTQCLAPTKHKTSTRISRKLASIPKKVSSSGQKQSDVTQTRLSFGVFPIDDPPPLSSLPISNYNHESALERSATDSPSATITTALVGSCTPAPSCTTGSVTSTLTNAVSSVDLSAQIMSGNASATAGSAVAAIGTSTTATNSAISRAPVKKPQTRIRTKQSLALNGANPRNLTAKLQLANQLNTQPPDNNNFTMLGNACTGSPTTSLRRSTRLFNSGSSVKENSSKSARTNQENSKKSLQSGSKTPSKRIKMATAQSVTSSATNEYNDFPQKPQDKQQPAAMTEQLKQAALKMRRASAEGLLTLLSSLGQSALAIGQFRCHDAIGTLESLPRKHYNSGWVLTALGRAYFELGKYDEAVKYFEESRRLEPHTLQGTEYYSTALWHLQREVKLSMLAHELLELDKLSPQTWCVAGNCFSLQKEHEVAIKFLQRAIQLDSDFAYAYTLLGHELVLTEEMDHAMACFRNALRIDARHYNALYGIGMIYYKQEKFKMAELHYRKALSISCNPVLMCHLAVVQHSLKKPQTALQTLNRAIEMDPKNALCKFHRASIKFSMDEHDQALQELDELKQIVPKESLVYFLIGKVIILFRFNFLL